MGNPKCVIVINGRFAATLRFRDAPRDESRSFMKHLIPKHQFQHIMDVSIDRESEVKYLADKVEITEIYAEKSPEEKRDISPNATTPTMRNFLIERIFVLRF